MPLNFDTDYSQPDDDLAEDQRDALISAGVAFIPQESCICLRCDAEIPTHCILTRMRKHRPHVIEPTRQQVEARCPHCGITHALTRELRGGAWQIVGGVVEVRNRMRLAEINQRIAAKQGDRVISRTA